MQSDYNDEYPNIDGIPWFLVQQAEEAHEPVEDKPINDIIWFKNQAI